MDTEAEAGQTRSPWRRRSRHYTEMDAALCPSRPANLQLATRTSTPLRGVPRASGHTSAAARVAATPLMFKAGPRRPRGRRGPGWAAPDGAQPTPCPGDLHREHPAAQSMARSPGPSLRFHRDPPSSRPRPIRPSAEEADDRRARQLPRKSAKTLRQVFKSAAGSETSMTAMTPAAPSRSLHGLFLRFTASPILAGQTSVAASIPGGGAKQVDGLREGQ